MDVGAARSFLEEHHRAVLATRRMDGSPQMSPVTCALAPDGRVVVSTREGAMKTHNVQRDPSVSLCVFQDGFFGQWIQVNGYAEVLSLPEVMPGLVAYYRTVSGEHPDWDEYRRAMNEQRRVLLAIAIEHVGPDRQG